MVFCFLRRTPSNDGNNSTAFIIDSKFYLGETMSSICLEKISWIMIWHLDRKSSGNRELVVYFCKLHVILDKS